MSLTEFRFAHDQIKIVSRFIFFSIVEKTKISSDKMVKNFNITLFCRFLSKVQPLLTYLALFLVHNLNGT